MVNSLLHNLWYHTFSSLMPCVPICTIRQHTVSNKHFVILNFFYFCDLVVYANFARLVTWVSASIFGF